VIIENQFPKLKAEIDEGIEAVGRQERSKLSRMEQIPCPCCKKSANGNGVITLEAQPPTQAVQCRG
jgi:hypothetical protein